MNRMGGFDLWKMVFALVIVIHHSNLLPADVSDPLFRGGSIGVEFFFLVSGFLLVRSASKVEGCGDLGARTARFIVKKIKSFFPYFVFAMLVTFVFKGLALDWNLVAFGKNALNSVVELSFVRMAGMGDVFFNQPTWYLSTMVISMMILYPLVLKYRGLMTKVVFPVAGIFILGYLFQRYGQFRTPDAWDGLFYKGMLRGFAEIMLGGFCYELCSWLKRFEFTSFSKALFTLAEFAPMLFVIAYSNTANCWDLDCPTILLMMAVTVIAGANVTLFAPTLGRSKLVAWLGKFSLLLYLNHLYWIYIFKAIGLSCGYYEMTILFVVASVSSSLVCWAVSDFVVRLARNETMRKVFLRESA